MLASVIHARDRFLRPGGLMAPSQCSILLSLASDQEFYDSSVLYWSNVYGFKMDSMRENIHKEAHIGHFKPEVIASTVSAVKAILPQTDTKESEQAGFRSDFQLRVMVKKGKSTTMHGFLAWFDTFFTAGGREVPSLVLNDGEQAWSTESSKAAEAGGKEIAFSTGPTQTEAEATHWKQTLFLFERPIEMTTGDIVRGTFNCRKSPDNSRELEIDMIWSVTPVDGGKAIDYAQAWVVC